jgi:hypothetical protein
MERVKAQEFLRSIFGRAGDTAELSRRDTLAGLGLAGLLLAAPKLLSSSPAEAKALDKPAEAAAAASPKPEANAAEIQGAEAGALELNPGDTADVTELSSYHRYWHRPRWRRRYWRRRYWRRRYWRRRRYW